MLARKFLKLHDSKAALTVAADYAQRFPSNGALALLHAKALGATGSSKAAADLLSSLNLLPCEGNTEAHSLYRQSYLMLALERLRSGACDEALQLIDKARQWPEGLGAGKPYPSEIDERLEDWLSYQCHLKRNARTEASQDLEQILSFRSRADRRDVGKIIQALALRQVGRGTEAETLLKDWLREDPSSELGRWGMQIVSGRVVSLPPEIQDANCLIFAGSL
jgi:tetratricopeptide (TPR) repeat protein